MDLKILVVTPFFPPIVGGTSLYVYRLVKGLMDWGIQVRVHTIRNEAPQKVTNFDLDLDNINVVSFKRPFNFKGSPNDQPISLSYITSTLKASRNFDIIHVHDSPKVCNDFLILTLKKVRPNQPLIFTPHGGFVSLTAYERPGITSSIYKFSSKIYWSLGIPHRVLRSVDHIVAVSQFQAKMFAKLCGGHKVSMIPESIPPCYFVDKPNFGDDCRLKILFIGRIAQDKGIENLLNALHTVTKTCVAKNGLQLVCIGPENGYLQEALTIIDDLQLNDVVKLLGPLPEREKMKYLSWCDVLVLPSYYEAFGIPILEAMAQGKPTIATETVGGKSLIRHGETGYLVRIGESEDIARLLIKFLEDPQLKYRMGQRALEHASRFTLENMIKSHLRIFENLIARN